jgi:YVTN family beta-propeller protein
MKQRLLQAALAVSLAFSPGCANTPAGGGNSASGSIAITRDDALLYAADSDLNQVFVVDAKSNAVTATINVGKQPEKVLIAPDETVYVANRMDRSISVLRRGEANEAARIAVAVEPVGLAISSDSKTLFVVNATSLTDPAVGTLMAIDTATRQVKWEVAVGNEPRGITLMDNKAVVTLYKAGEIVMVDVNKGAILQSANDTFNQLNRAVLANGLDSRNLPPGRAFSTSKPHGLESITTSADGTQVFVTTLLSTDGVLLTSGSEPLGTPVSSSGSSGYGTTGSCGTTAVTSPGILTFDGNGNALVDDISTCASDTTDRPPTLLLSDTPGEPVQGPRAMVADPSGNFLFVANFNSNNIAIVPTGTRPNTTTFGNTQDVPSPRGQFGIGGTVRQLVNVGNGPTGIAVSHDGAKAWVNNSFDHSISRLESVANRVSNVATLKLADDVLPADVVAGRKLFFSATDSRMNNPSIGIACGGCHLEGRDDAHVWNFPEGPRQTPSLAGRMLSKTAPFHWNGEFNDLMAFMSLTVERRMGGTGVTQAMERQVAAFLDAQATPDNAAKTSTPAEVLVRGRAAFDKAACGSCHNGEAYTDNSFANVGTLVASDVLPQGKLNTPSLLGISRTAPYLHDGSAPTLKARILQGKETNSHGNTAQLTDGEVDDLVSYLKTL